MNPRELPARLAATLAKGLGETSRVMRKLSGNAPLELTLQAMTLDSLRWLQWAQTVDGAHNRRRPESVAAKLNAAPAERKRKVNGYDSGAEFDKAWKELTENV